MAQNNGNGREWTDLTAEIFRQLEVLRTQQRQHVASTERLESNVATLGEALVSVSHAVDSMRAAMAEVKRTTDVLGTAVSALRVGSTEAADTLDSLGRILAEYMDRVDKRFKRVEERLAQMEAKTK